MKVLIVGAGAVASVLSKQLSKDRHISEIVCASNDIKRAREFIGANSRDMRAKSARKAAKAASKISIAELDASDKRQIANAARDFDLAINASLPNFNRNIMEASLKAGANYQDLCSWLRDCRHAEQLRLHKKFKRECLAGLINAGISPGITNLLAREAADKLDRVFEIKIRTIEEQKGSELVFAWSPEVTLDELTAKPLAYRNGRFVLLRQFGGLEEYNFPKFGRKHAVNVYGDEISTIPHYIKTKNIDYKACGTDIEFSKALWRLGLFSKKPISVHGKKVVPLEFFKKISPKVPSPKKMLGLLKSGVIENAVFSAVVEATGSEQGKKIKIKNTALFPDLKEISKRAPGATYISYPTGIAAAAFSKVIPRIGEYGVFPPEALGAEARRDALVALEGSGIVIEEEFSKA